MDEPKRNVLEHYPGNAIRELRQRDALTIADVSAAAGIGRGMLSKIETGQASMSLDTLERVAVALGVPLAQLFRHYNIPRGSAQRVRHGEAREVVRRGTRHGHTYRLLAYDAGPQQRFEPS